MNGGRVGEGEGEGGKKKRAKEERPTTEATL